MKAKISFSDRVFFLDNVTECRGFMKLIGLMFKNKERANALLFSFSKPTMAAIHSFFVFFPFVAVWLLDGKVIEIILVKPFSFHVTPKKAFNQLIEIPMNNSYREVTDFLVADGKV